MDSRTVLAEKASRLSQESVARVTARIRARVPIFCTSVEEALRRDYEIWCEELDIELASQKQPN